MSPLPLPGLQVVLGPPAVVVVACTAAQLFVRKHLELRVRPSAGVRRHVEGVIAHAIDVTLLVRSRQDLERSLTAQRLVADTLQRSLLPSKLPDVPGAGRRYRPGGVGVDVGGDWYDVFPTNGGLVGFAVGDVVGRGVAAAATMGQLRTAVRAIALEVHSPGRILERMTRLAQDLNGYAMVATLVVGVLDLQGVRLLLAAAGHPPPLVIHPDGRTWLVEDGRTTPIGVTFETPPDATLDLEEGTTILCYTVFLNRFAADDEAQRPQPGLAGRHAGAPVQVQRLPRPIESST